MELFEAPALTRYLPEYLDSEGFSGLQRELARTPEAGDLISGTGGFRKTRWGDLQARRRGNGREGELAVIFCLLCRGTSNLADDVVWEK